MPLSHPAGPVPPPMAKSKGNRKGGNATVNSGNTPMGGMMQPQTMGGYYPMQPGAVPTPTSQGMPPAWGMQQQQQQQQQQLLLQQQQQQAAMYAQQMGMQPYGAPAGTTPRQPNTQRSNGGHLSNRGGTKKKSTTNTTTSSSQPGQQLPAGMQGPYGMMPMSMPPGYMQAPPTQDPYGYSMPQQQSQMPMQQQMAPGMYPPQFMQMPPQQFIPEQTMQRADAVQASTHARQNRVQQQMFNRLDRQQQRNAPTNKSTNRRSMPNQNMPTPMGSGNEYMPQFTPVQPAMYPPQMMMPYAQPEGAYY